MSEQTYDWTTLEPDEEVLWEGEPHRYSLVPAFIIGIPLSIVLVGLAIIAWAWIDRENTEYVITNRAVYRKRGALSRSVQRVAFEKIQNTSLRQGVFGTQFDYGNVEISTAGSEGSEVSFRAVETPRSVQRRINERLEEVRGEDEGATESDEEDVATILRDIREDLRAIRSAVEE